MVQEREWEQRIDSVNLSREQANIRLLAATDDSRSLGWEAEAFTRGNVVVDHERFVDRPEVNLPLNGTGWNNFSRFYIRDRRVTRRSILVAHYFNILC